MDEVMNARRPATRAARGRVGQVVLAAALAIGCESFTEASFNQYSALPEPLPPEVGGSGGRAGSGSAGEGPSAGRAGADNAGGAGGSNSDPGDAGAPPASDAGVAGGPGLPADPAVCDEACTHAGGRCEGQRCVFDCSDTASCAGGQIICPPGSDCEVRCGTYACADNVICRGGARCAIRCEGMLSCAAEIICNGDCDVECVGPRACAGGIGGTPRSLELECSGALSCAGNTQCQGPRCAVECSGAQACQQVVLFGDVNVLSCSGSRSCEESVFCSGAACDIDCDEDACAGGVECRALDCDGDD